MSHINLLVDRLPKKWASKHQAGHNEQIPGTTNYLRSRTFQSWFNMIVRTHYSSHEAYKNYGGRGITVSRRWYDFQLFLQDMGHRPRGTTLDRIRVNGNYCASNCRWSTPTVQANNKRTSRKYSHAV